MSRIPPLDARRVIKILERAGFRVARQKGSHLIMISDKKTRIVIPVHPGRDLKPGLIQAIMKEAGLSREEFLKLLEKA